MHRLKRLQDQATPGKGVMMWPVRERHRILAPLYARQPALQVSTFTCGKQKHRRSNTVPTQGRKQQMWGRS